MQIGKIVPLGKAEPGTVLGIDRRCAQCGEPTTVCYTDGGALALVHGQYLCRRCYIDDRHPECPHCHELTYDKWRYCAHCGQALKGGL